MTPQFRLWSQASYNHNSLHVGDFSAVLVVKNGMSIDHSGGFSDSLSSRLSSSIAKSAIQVVAVGLLPISGRRSYSIGTSLNLRIS